MTRPCAIPDCPALARDGSRWCAIHAAMSELERTRERLEAEARHDVPIAKTNLLEK